MLTAEQRAELEALGPETVRAKLIQPGLGRGADLAGFKTGYLTRGDVEDWLTEKYTEEESRQESILRWAKIAGWAAIVSVLVGVAGIVVAFLAK
jgi:hypothetical protein